MFLPSNRINLFAGLAVIFAMTSSNIAQAQQADYNRRLTQMEAARAQSSVPNELRVATAATGEEYEGQPSAQTVRRLPASRRGSQPRIRTASGSDTRVARTRVPASLRSETRTDRRVRPAGATSRVASRSSATVQASRSTPVASRYSPAHLRTAQLHEETIVDEGSPVIGNASVVTGRPIGGGVRGGCASCSDGLGCSQCGGESYGLEIEGGCSDCGGCFDCGDACCGRGGCNPEDCWLSGLGGLLRNGEYFSGAQGFHNALFQHPGLTNEYVDDSSFGFHTGMNLGLPLCRLTCGVFSGQIGFRSVQTNFNGNEFSAENRDQHFVTMGLYRRVDYGLQFGVVADILHEDWFSETTTVQVRSDLSYVWAGGTTFGFRYADSTQDDIEPGTIDGVEYADIVTRSEDWYRFYLRRDLCAGGWGEMAFGWTDSNQAIFNMQTDVPICERLSAQGTFTYYLGDDEIPSASGRQGGNLGDAWNVGVSLVWRPRGRAWYNSYDRPLFDVADNGTMLMKRE